ncbi:hypothetical protein RclHR1_03260016 [Rhizophagus clarus]|uniref:CsbD family protein n=1 Tax=Rhizophagus clarus TaxID=94130 RepID=A0A2Z6S3D7_9GLOM|nr:hypothetical protein RclHR1_03260016 [Rhizophagus clarus]GES76957.1 CsbD family protein [Rhizophagus clarus]
MSNNPNTEHATGTAQESVGNVVGSENLKAKGQANKAEGNKDTSYLGTNETNKEPSKTTGQLHATKGAVKETLGSALGRDSLEHSGAQERQAGNQEIDAAKTHNATKGAGGQVKGAVKENVGYATGDPQWEAEGKGERVKGQAQYNANQ